jgi:hypothetical protein
VELCAVCDEADVLRAFRASKSLGVACIFISMTRFFREVMTAGLRCRDPEQRRVCAVAFPQYSEVHDDGVEAAAELALWSCHIQALIRRSGKW